LGVSASANWDINYFSQEGGVINTNVYSGISQLFYMQQKFNVGQKTVVTVNPDALMNFDITSLSGNIKLGKSIKYTYGPGEWGLSFNHKSNDPDIDYSVRKHSIKLSNKGISYKYKEEEVFTDPNISSDKYQVKVISTKECNTNTVKIEGILLIALSITVFLLLGQIIPIDRLIPDPI
jgi:hypothetical protein